MTALHYASGKGHRETVQLLLEKGADLNVQDKVIVLKSSLYLYLQYIPQYVMVHCGHDMHIGIAMGNQ